ncbi:16S rRNA (guanine(527)-N(7))-methyltransferase RsmG [Streptococcus sp. NLN76]|uniref:16S rRNA (guanine(527)-N(7))-methyltransferase RsmG n=1 Tax=Streptococcus sp. NLN76 TaxID=2822800 RepID=UPI0018A9401A|nr:16S rRNA (guanine(527)-N(7))-methyltransferase RsmG [Streptococcus sp. NLN76]MBF8970069.1 16S rRNA (guanine(527)-N(7))-methyltransferase RsmG [Streptococcus sp. NLN76]
MKPEIFYQKLEEQGFPLSQKQKQQFETYYELLVEWNQKINLTAITDKEEVYLKHFYDSLAPVFLGHITNQSLQLLDIGAGAGFPSLPIKILLPEIEVTIIDSLNKRIQYLQLLSEKLELDKVRFIHGRAEDLGQNKDYRATFNRVTARAVARLPILLELTIPFLKLNGQLLALKASDAAEEIEEAKNASSILFTKLISTENYQLPNGDPRALTILEKRKETPNKYPRKAGIPAKRPL